jgi:hypothetical protein
LVGIAFPLTEVTVLTIAAVLAAPLVLPLVLERISKVKLGVLEFDLAQARAEVVDEKLAYELVSFDVKIGTLGLEKPPDLTTLASISESGGPAVGLATAIKDAEKTSVIEVNLDGGDSWLSTRLFLLAALVEDYTGICQMIFLENRQNQDRVFVGSAAPATVRQGLAWNSPRLKEAYEVAKRESALAIDKDASQKGVAWIARSFLSNLYAQNPEEGLQEWVTTQLLEQSVQIRKYCFEWNGGRPATLLLHRILDQMEPYVPLVRSSGQLNLVIDRVKLAERVAKDSLRQRLEGSTDRTESQ